LLSLVGDSFKEVLKEAGIKVGNQIGKQLIAKIPGKFLIEINKKVGYRLITKAGEKGIVNLTKLIPIAGGFIGGSFDAVACRTVGKTARTIFCPGSRFVN
jgi:hypothetical protein